MIIATFDTYADRRVATIKAEQHGGTLVYVFQDKQVLSPIAWKWSAPYMAWDGMGYATETDAIQMAAALTRASTIAEAWANGLRAPGENKP